MNVRTINVLQIQIIEWTQRCSSNTDKTVIPTYHMHTSEYYHFNAEIILPLPVGRGGRKVVAFIVDFVSHYPNLFQLARK